MKKVACESKFQGATADNPQYFEWEPSCLYLKLFLFTFKYILLYLGQSLFQVSGTFDEQASILDKVFEWKKYC